METTITKCNGLKYEEEKWNGEILVCNYTNCYAYAINVPKNPLTDKIFINWSHIQPGNLGGINENYKCWNIEQNEEFVTKFINAVKEDLERISYQIIPSTFEEISNDGWKVALCFNTWDYHWYRLNDDGTWSHKSGKSRVTKRDEDWNIIINPKVCNRGSYNNFIGFYMIKKL